MPGAWVATAAVHQRAHPPLGNQRRRFDGGENVADQCQRMQVIAARGAVLRRHPQAVRRCPRRLIGHTIQTPIALTTPLARGVKVSRDPPHMRRARQQARPRVPVGTLQQQPTFQPCTSRTTAHMPAIGNVPTHRVPLPPRGPRRARPTNLSTATPPIATDNTPPRSSTETAAKAARARKG